jgi:hypothetical protein
VGRSRADGELAAVPGRPAVLPPAPDLIPHALASPAADRAPPVPPRRTGEDRLTFQLRRPDRIQLVFHRGAKVRADAGSFAFDDPTGLLEWAAPDRAVVTFTDVIEVEAHTAALAGLVSRWVQA